MNSSSCRAYLEDTVPAPGTRGAGCGDRGWLPGATVPTPPSWVDGSCRPCWGSARPPPFCFCIKGGEAFFFLGYIYTSQIRKCPNQIGQVATGNHSSKLFFFFHSFLKPHVEGKLTKCRLAVLCTQQRSRLSTQREQRRPGPDCLPAPLGG